MMRNSFCIALALLMGHGLNAQDADLAEKVLFTIDYDTVTAGEYMAVYNKNREVGQEIDPKTPREYLDLYLNFKLKVHEAKELGKDTLASFIREYQSYRNQLAEPYLSDEEVTEELVREAYQRQKEDIRAAHIMVALPQNPSPEDTLKAWEEIVQLQSRLNDGEDFSALAKAESDDKYSAERGGDLGFFTVFDMVYPFESAAYEGKIGQVNGPVRSQFGYHLVKPLERRPARGVITVAHLMLIDNPQTEAEKSANAEARIQEIYSMLLNGASFDTLVMQYSEDKNSARQGGLLQPFGINKMYPEFEEAAFALQDSGAISKPVKTPVGWHIIKLVQAPQAQSFEDQYDALRNRVERDVRARQSRESVIRRIKKEYQYQEFPERFSIAFNQVDESLFSNAYQVGNPRQANKVLFSFAGREYTVGDFLRWLADNQRRYSKNTNLQAQLYAAMRDYSREQLLAYEKALLPKKYPDFRLLDREYYEGILLFDLTNEKVWQKAMRDSAGLADFYALHRDRYRWDSRYRMLIVDAESEKLAKKAQKLVEKGQSRDEVLSQLNVESQLSVAIDSGLYQASEWDLPADLVIPRKGSSAIYPFRGRYTFTHVYEVEAPRAKTLEENKGEVISDYQDYLEKEWIADLRKQYPVNINASVLEQVLSALND